jgi:3-deoxy-D-manno-octulosonate 8-phosphate phosphatase (KDO 8-P phosphatase)
MDYQRLHQIFTETGGEFALPLSQFAEKLHRIKAFFFDWDGVFNNGTKGKGFTSVFNEPDSMGTNLLRLGYWLKNNKQLPLTGIITALQNDTAIQFAEREHFNYIFSNFKDKRRAFDYVCKLHNIQPEEVAFFFDDAVDLSVAKICGVRIMLKRTANPLLTEFARENKLFDYLTAHAGGEYGIREACELILGLTSLYDLSVIKRMNFDEEYDTYWNERQSQKTRMFAWDKGAITTVQ